uniref:Uncharacterized protein n=1 Tax=Glossina pallidipes TaxID=7398 RepID=A0A1A9ZTD4_GLOPL
MDVSTKVRMYSIRIQSRAGILNFQVRLHNILTEGTERQERNDEFDTSRPWTAADQLLHKDAEDDDDDDDDDHDDDDDDNGDHAIDRGNILFHVKFISMIIFLRMW